PSVPTAEKNRNESAYRACDKCYREACCVPANAANKRRVDPQSEFIERQNETEAVQQSDPRPPAGPVKQESEINGDRQNEYSISMDVHSKRFAVDTGEQKAEEPRAA